jgi:hypothetical protein
MKPIDSCSRPLLALSLALAACAVPASAGSASGSAPETPVRPLTAAGAPVTLGKPATSDELAGLAKSDNAFALDLYGVARAQKGNLVMSPFSISTALGMTFADPASR